MPGHCKNERRQVPDGDRIQEFARYLLRDPHRENAIKDTIGWGHNRSYKASFIDDQSVPTRVLRVAYLESKVSPSWSANFHGARLRRQKPENGPRSVV
jgi:hypothetical protein